MEVPNTTQSFALPIFFAIYMFKYNVWMAIACLIPVIIGFVLMMAMMMGDGGDFVRTYQKSSADMSAAVVNKAFIYAKKNVFPRANRKSLCFSSFYYKMIIDSSFVPSCRKTKLGLRI
ncbi:MAG: hypothetical protein IIV45_07630 [Lachnospiraceae bacterium]|nr:hypothetical protein [Lachnospiraceae bacterium]